MPRYPKRRVANVFLAALVMIGSWAAIMFALDPIDVSDIDGDIPGAPVGGADERETRPCFRPPAPSNAAVDAPSRTDPARTSP